MKYIMLRRENQDVPIVFPDFLNHRDVAARMMEIISLARARVVSAGNVRVLALETSGASSGLELDARPEDAAIMTCWDLCAGMEPMPPYVNLWILREITQAAFGDLANRASR